MRQRSNPKYIMFAIFLFLLFSLLLIGFCRAVYAQNNIELVKQKWFIEQYDKYAKECYADSSLVATHLPIVGNCYWFSPGEGRCINLKHYEENWKRKQPTFEGFIEWLKKQ